MVFSKAAIELLRLKYCRDNETPEEVFTRVAVVLGKDKGLEKEFEKIMTERKFLPNSPCIRNAGYSNNLKACFVLPIHDSMQSIMKTFNDAALIFKEGGGVGYNFSELRPAGWSLSSGGESSGVVSFMKLFDQLTETVKQGGFRRGASMGVLRYEHPEIENFIREKLNLGCLNNFNVSILLDDAFFKLLDEDEFVLFKDPTDRRRVTGKLKARDLFTLLSSSAWMTGDPGLLFFDRINKDNIYKQKINCTNPCGEQNLLPYESCCLGSINLNEIIVDNDIDYAQLEYLTEMGANMLMAVNKINEFPVKDCYEMQQRTWRIGLGVMGFADALVKMHIKYDSKECLDVIDKIGKPMRDVAKKTAPKSVSVLSIAPTGSLSIIAGCSPSIEPIWSVNYYRQLRHGVVQETREDSEYIRTAHQVSPEWHLEVQAQWQKWIDNGVSKTVNLPSNAGIKDVMDIYRKAWKMGCKGVTVFRDGCRGDGEQVFVSKCDGDNCYL